MNFRLCSYNIEWFNRLFNKDNSLKEGTAEQKRLTAIQHVLLKINPDLLGIVEAPNSASTGSESAVIKLENFARHFNLSTQKALTGFTSPGNQEIAVLYNPDKLSITHSPGGKKKSRSNPPFDEEFFFDTDEDRIKEVYKFYRPPLEADVIINHSGAEFKLMVAHPKSKGIFNNMDRIHWERESQRSRLKLYAECTWIRKRIDEWLNNNHPVVVMGDFNDGPGMDYYEFKFGKSAVEIIMGNLFDPEKILLSKAGRPKWTASGWKPSSARFKDAITGDYVNVLIDYILVSSKMPLVTINPYNIWNPFDHIEAKTIKNDLKTASDHYPVTLDLDI